MRARIRHWTRGRCGGRDTDIGEPCTGKLPGRHGWCISYRRVGITLRAQRLRFRHGRGLLGRGDDLPNGLSWRGPINRFRTGSAHRGGLAASPHTEKASPGTGCRCLGDDSSAVLVGDSQRCYLRVIVDRIHDSCPATGSPPTRTGCRERTSCRVGIVLLSSCLLCHPSHSVTKSWNRRGLVLLRCSRSGCRDAQTMHKLSRLDL